ncbi:unnamed protein product [Brachionus calyciflorus]|uniref:SWIM-type domain-containing protein n=1 Tax=Brachionus calyciflorus TaxID=104777 RepID=A0A814IS86_9BILA|nr:unnamed protein product [Brachionus calyciflorus]
MATILVDCTKSQTYFDLSLRHNNSMVINSMVYGEANFIKITENTFYYSADGMRKFYLQLDSKFCSCSQFYLEAICRHYIALARVNNIKLSNEERKFMMIRGNWEVRKSISDCFTWRCSKCGSSSTKRYNSCFSYFDKEIIAILTVIFYWCFQMVQSDIIEIVDISRPTINKIFQKLRLITIEELNKEKVILGGPGEVVEIDESLFVQVKHGVGKDLAREQIWVFGIFQR